VIHEKMTIKSYCVDHLNNEIAYISNTIYRPDELFVDHAPVTKINHHIKGAGAETFWLKSNDGTHLQAWIMKPAGFQDSNRYPLLLVIHGGPHNMFGYEFDERMQMLSAAGYGVVFMNPRGSTGYGQAFAHGNLMNWGGKDYQDLMSAVDHAIATYDWVDADKLGVTGQSYGGFMTNWIITQTTRFKAAVSDGGISNLISFAGTSLYHCLLDAEYNGPTWKNYDALWNWSPLKYVEHATTPTLFLHGEKDNEVPISQSEEIFTALKKSRVETVLVRYLEEGHGWRPDLKPLTRLDTFEKMISWFNLYLK
jgi:dipeptidyl aminopeptidase/acylaminoacyl peptidase